MRKLILFITVLFSLQAACQPAAVKKVIRKYDAKYLKSPDGFTCPSMFWDNIQKNDPRVKKLVEAYNRNDKTLIEAFNCLLYYMENDSSYDIITNDYANVVSKLVGDLGMDEIARKNPIKVIQDYNINASMDALEQMRINSGCFQRLTYKELLAVCAHELAHLACDHVSYSVWETAKKRKANRMWADIGAALAVGAIAATSGYGAYNGQDVSHFNDILSHSDLIFYGAEAYADDATIKYRYRYSRDQETEADIIAYRFMEQLGYRGENVLSMLKKIMAVYGDTPGGKYNDHPSMSFRIQVISALMNGYSGK